MELRIIVRIYPFMYPILMPHLPPLKRYACFLWLFFYWSISAAGIPPSFLWNGKPIDALCFSDLNKDQTIIALNHCGLTKDRAIIPNVKTPPAAQGYLGYPWKEAANKSPIQGYSYYTFFPKGKGEYWVYTINNSGGSGERTALYTVRRTSPSTMEARVVQAGDRCNGGVQDLRFKQNQLTYSVHLTPFDFLTLDQKSTPSIQPYTHVAACALCCIAKAFYSMHDSGAPTVDYIDLGASRPISALPAQGTQQICFNRLFVAYLEKGRRRLSKAALLEFSNQFMAQCASKGAS